MYMYGTHSSAYKTAYNNRPPEDEPSGSKETEDKKLKIKILIKKGTFFWFILHKYSTIDGTKHLKFNIFCFCTVTMVTRMRLDVTIRLRCLSCL